MPQNKNVFSKPYFWVSVGTVMLLLLAYYLSSVVISGIKPSTVFEVTTKPENVQILWNGDDLGTTPYTFDVSENLRGTLQLKYPGYRDITREIDIETGKIERIRFDLKQDTKLIVNSKPEGNLYIDKELWGSTPMTIDGELSPGLHTIKVELLDDCYGSVEKSITLETGAPLLIEREELQLPKLVNVVFSTNPIGATVTSGGEEWGVTPFSKCLDSSEYEVEIVKDGYVTEREKLQVEMDMNLHVNLYDPESYKKKDSFIVDSNAQGARVFSIARKAGSSAEIYGQAVNLGSVPVKIEKDELFQSTSIDTEPFAYVFGITASGYQAGITELDKPGETFFKLPKLSNSGANAQSRYSRSFKVSSPETSGLESPNSSMKIENSSVVELSGATHKLYLEPDFKHNSFTWSSDNGFIWYFRNNQGKRELVRMNTNAWEIEVVDTIDLPSISWARGLNHDLIYQCITSVVYDPAVNRIYYLAPGANVNTLTLMSNTPAGGNPTEVERNLLPAVDRWSLSLEASGVVKLVGYFPGLKRYEGLYLINDMKPVRFKVDTTPNPNITIGRMKILGNGMAFFQSIAYNGAEGSNAIVGARLYDRISMLFAYNSMTNDYEMLDLRFD